MLIMKWDTRRIKNIVASIDSHVFGAAKLSTLNLAGGEDFSDEINRAMLALNMALDSEADEVPSALSALSVVSSAPVSESAPSGPSGPYLDGDLAIQPAEEGSVSQAAAHTNVKAADEADVDEVNGEIGRGQGKAKTKGKKAAASQSNICHGRSRKN